MTHAQKIEEILRREYLNQCQHKKLMLVAPETSIDVEGGTFGLRCMMCGEMVEEGVVYE